MTSFLDSIYNFQKKFFSSYKKNATFFSSHYQFKIDYNFIFSPSELKLLYKLCFNKFFKDKKILEIGCGAGQLSTFLNLCNIRTDAIDFDKRYTSLCKDIQNDFNISYMIYENIFFNLSEEIFTNYDCIISADCICNINNDLNKSLAPFKNFEKFVFVNGNSFVDFASPDIKMKSIIFFKDQEVRSLKLLKSLSNYK